MKKSFILISMLLFPLVACAPTNYETKTRRERAAGNTQTAKYEAKTNENQVKLLQERVETLEKSLRQQKADQNVLLEDLRVEIKTLRGNLDVLRFDLKTLQKKSDRIHTSFNDRIAELEKSPKSSSATKAQDDSKPTAKSTQSMTGVDDISRYNEILRRILDEKDYDTSISQFREFIKNYPDSRYAANAQYWIGEGFFAKKDYQKAIVEFQKVIDKHPGHEKACDALLKQGISFRELEESSKARLFLSEVPRKCPDSKSATRAKQELSSLSQ